MTTTKYTSIDNVITVAGVDLSADIDNCQLPEQAGVNDTTNYGSAGYREVQGGIRSLDLTLELFQNFDASRVAATLRPLINTAVTVTIKPRNTTVSATNPVITVSCLLSKYDHITGAVGQTGKMSLQWPVSGAPGYVIAP